METTQRILFIVIGLATTVMSFSAYQFAPPSYNNFYALYSWTDSSGQWRFSLLGDPSGVNLRADQIFDKKFTLRGIKDLELKIAALPRKSIISWYGELPNGGPDIKRSEHVGYPPEKIRREIQGYAERHNVAFDIVKGTDEILTW